MAFIYKITNQLNQKCYIGKTMLSIQERWIQHLRDAVKDNCNNRPLYKAINKYGKDNFIIEQIEECSDKIVNEREQYWIKYYNSYHNGYNATLGGDGKAYIDYDLVCEVYQKEQNITKTAKIVGCSTDSVSYILKNRNIKIASTAEINKKNLSKKVYQYDLDNNFLKEFISLGEAAEYLIKIGVSKSTKDHISTNIGRAAKGQRKIAYNFKWKFNNIE